jgi:hypothetical protein
MTEPTPTPTPTRAASPPRSVAALGAIWVTLAIFMAVLGLLALQVAAGKDPALRARAAATPLPPRRVLVRKVYERRVIVHLPASAPAQPTQASQHLSAAAGGYSLPVTRTS